MSDTSGGTLRPLYAVPMQNARASGDLQQMLALAAEARKQASQAPDIQAALADLEAEISRRSGS
jgi:hypothetical protein